MSEVELNSMQVILGRGDIGVNIMDRFYYFAEEVLRHVCASRERFD